MNMSFEVPFGVFRLSFVVPRGVHERSGVKRMATIGRRSDVVGEVVGHPHTKIWVNSFARLAAVARQSRRSKGVNYGEMGDVGSSLTMSTAAGGPLESSVTSRDRLSVAKGLVEAPEVVDM